MVSRKLTPERIDSYIEALNDKRDYESPTAYAYATVILLERDYKDATFFSLTGLVEKYFGLSRTEAIIVSKTIVRYDLVIGEGASKNRSWKVNLPLELAEATNLWRVKAQAPEDNATLSESEHAIVNQAYVEAVQSCRGREKLMRALAARLAR